MPTYFFTTVHCTKSCVHCTSKQLFCLKKYLFTSSSITHHKIRLITIIFITCTFYYKLQLSQPGGFDRPFKQNELLNEADTDKRSPDDKQENCKFKSSVKAYLAGEIVGHYLLFCWLGRRCQHWPKKRKISQNQSSMNEAGKQRRKEHTLCGLPMTQSRFVSLSHKQKLHTYRNK